MDLIFSDFTLTACEAVSCAMTSPPNRGAALEYANRALQKPLQTFP